MLFIALLTIITGVGVCVTVYIANGLSLIYIHKDSIESAFKRDPSPFKPNQLWLVKLMMLLFWPKVNWLDEVFYYKTGLPEWRKRKR